MTPPLPGRGALNVWIVNPYGWLPGEGWRDYRSAPLAAALAARGHVVRWWISDIEHRSRKRRTLSNLEVTLPAGITVDMVKTREYTGNMSLGRIQYERSFAAGFARKSRELPVPDAIVLAEPALFFAGPVVSYARRHGIPFVLDGIDLWPEMFHLALPKPLRSIGRAIYAPLYRRRDRIVAQASAIVAVTADYLAKLTRRVSPRLSEVVYLGVDRSEFREPMIDRTSGSPLEVVYAGNLGAAYDMPALLAAVEQLATNGRPVHFTFAGAGPWEKDVAAQAERFPEHVRFLGRVAPEMLPNLYAGAQVGLATYSRGSTVSMPTKLFDYLAAGLATVGSMGGEAEALLREGAGRHYRAGSVDDLIAAIDFYIDFPAALAHNRRFARSCSAQFDKAAQYDRFCTLIERSVGR